MCLKEKLVNCHNRLRARLNGYNISFYLKDGRWYVDSSSLPNIPENKRRMIGGSDILLDKLNEIDTADIIYIGKLVLKACPQKPEHYIVQLSFVKEEKGGYQYQADGDSPASCKVDVDPPMFESNFMSESLFPEYIKIESGFKLWLGKGLKDFYGVVPKSLYVRRYYQVL